MMADLKASDSQQHLVARPSKSKLLPTPVTVSGVSFISSVWVVMTFLVVSALVIAAGFPRWVNNHDPQQLRNLVSRADIGLYHFCFNQTGQPEFRECITYLQFTPPAESGLNPATLQDVAFILSSSVVYAFGVGMLIVSLMIGGVAYCKPRIKKLSMFLLAFFFQMIGGISLIVALVLFPLSFQSPFLQQLCGERASYYYRGQCTLDWSLFVAMVATACSLYLPALAIFAMNVSDGLRGHVCC